MSTRIALAELRRKKQGIELAIRALEQLQYLEEGGVPEAEGRQPRQTGTAKLIELPRRSGTD